MQLEALLLQLPKHLSERVRRMTPVQTDGISFRPMSNCPNDWTDVEPGSFVLYWTHHALRTEENPSLDVAMRTASEFGLPLLVYQGISEDYRYASDRHHQFMLEGAHSLQKQYEKLGITFAFHLEREGFRGPMLMELARKAAIVVTDDFPLEPIVGWLDRLARACRSPLLVVDSSCVVPMQLVGRPYLRAFEYRQATETLYRDRIPCSWPQVGCAAAPYQGAYPFQPLDLSNRSFAEWIAQCNIDHGVGPVGDTFGGSEEGNARWEQFKASGLRSYERKRNDPASLGVSRMSAYLHYGMVSPMKLAREAHESGAEKYVDELLIWRELAYVYCFYRQETETLEGIPEWARSTLMEHMRDPRPMIPSWESLARARSGDTLWDAAQRSLLKHGELHNNVRMTWGKQLLAWTKDPMAALHRIIDLNHRYALDGRDPASYGGILWCLGQFDRPFEPPQPIVGSVRPRPIADRAQWMDLKRFVARVDRPVFGRQPRIAMVGAGLGGLMASRILQDHGLEITLFEKSRGKGGRAATRRINPSLHFDHGAQYFTIRDPRLGKYLCSWLEDGIIAPWQGKIVEIEDRRIQQERSSQERYVGIPGMNALGNHLSRDLTIVTETKILETRQKGVKYVLTDDQGNQYGPFDVVLWNSPPEQTETALTVDCSWKTHLQRLEMTRCWALLVAWMDPWKVDFDGAFVNQGSLRWLCRNSSKPNRPNEHDSWIIHSTSSWAVEHWSTDREIVLQAMLRELSNILETPLPEPLYMDVHRWRYAAPVQALPQSALWDPQTRLGACGDWCGGPRIEGALLSGQALAGKVLGWLHAEYPNLETKQPLLF